VKLLSALAWALLFLSACAHNPSNATSARSPVASGPRSTASASPTGGGASPSAIPTPSPGTAVGLEAHCRLPVYWWDSPTSTQNHAGFVIFPGGQLVVDGSAPKGTYNAGLFYDRAYARWIFSYRDAVSPDGGAYAYAEGDPLLNQPGKLHVVDVATGADRVIYNSAFVPGVVQFTTDGIYFTDNQGEGAETGLWLIAARGGQPRLVSSTIWRPVVANGAAWGLTFNPADPHPAPGGIGSAENTVQRYDLTTGVSRVWWYQPGSDMHLLDGDYSGNLFVNTFREDVDGSLVDWVLDSQGTAHPIGTANLDALAAVDSNGIWFTDSRSSSLWLFANGQLNRIAGFSASGLTIAGGCIPEA
jgi:hypothetical protein